MKLWEDPRVTRGMRMQLDMRRQRLAGGDKSLGWKVGFGAPAMLKQHHHRIGPVPPLTLEPGEADIAFEVDPLGGVEVRFQ